MSRFTSNGLNIFFFKTSVQQLISHVKYVKVCKQVYKKVSIILYLKEKWILHIRVCLSLRHVIRKDYYPVKDFSAFCGPKENWHENVRIFSVASNRIYIKYGKQEVHLLLPMTFVSLVIKVFIFEQVCLNHLLACFHVYSKITSPFFFKKNFHFPSKICLNTTWVCFHL